MYMCICDSTDFSDHEATEKMYFYTENRNRKFPCIFHVSLNLADAEYTDTPSLIMT